MGYANCFWGIFEKQHSERELFSTLSESDITVGR